MRRGIAIGLVVAALAVGVGRAAAAPVPTFADACGSVNNLDWAVCERLDYVASEVSTIDAQQSADSTTLQVAAVGIWFASGLAFGTWLFSRLAREWNEWGGGA